MADKPKSIIDVDVDVDIGEVVETEVESVVDLADIKLTHAITELKLPGVDENLQPVTTGPLRLDRIKNCPRCNKPLLPAKAINGVESVSFLECPDCGTLINTFKPTTYQAVFLRRRERYKMSAGGFGCNPAGTKILMYDGSLKNVEDIVLGDQVMGVDNTPRTVTDLHRGAEQMYRIDITMNKKIVDSFEVTGSHALHLTPKGQYTVNNEVQYLTKPGTAITVDNYLALTKRAQSYLYLKYSDVVELPEVSLPIHPYLLGLLLGDGTLGSEHCVKITSSDKEVVDCIYQYIPEGTYVSKQGTDKGLNKSTYDYRICNSTSTTKINKGIIRVLLEQLGLYGMRTHDKFIPEVYLRTSSLQRLELLAGLIDTDGCRHGNNYRIYTVSKQLAYGIKRLASSLGIPTSVIYSDSRTIYVVCLYGMNILNIPVRIPRKRVTTRSSKDNLLRRFKVTPTTVKPFYGFTLDGDQLYIDGDTFVVQHNTGKSRVNIEDVIKHLLLIPKARVCVAARTYPAIDSTFKKEFESIFPEKLLKSKNDQKHEYSFTNGSELLYRSFDDPNKLKSMNLTKVVIIEASDIPYSGFTMMQSRLRNTAAMIPYFDAYGNPITVWDPDKKAYCIKYRVDARHINLETNPDSGWVKKDFLLDAATVEFYGDAYNEGYKFHKERDPEKYVQVISTSANPYLPPGYEEEQTRGKSQAYIQQFFKGSFNFSSNLVFPNFGLVIKPPHALPRAFNEDGKRVLFYLIGLDYGLSDPTHIIFAAFSTETKILYIYDELRMNNSDVKTIAREYRKQIKINNTDLRGLLMMPRFDGRSYNKRESDLVSIGGMFEAEGLFFEPSFASHEARIIKMNALINHEQMEIFSTCEFLIEEGLNYKFKLDKNGNPTKVPVDGNDHGITACEFIVVELPHNLQEINLSAYIPVGVTHIHDKRVDLNVNKKKDLVFDPLSQEDRNDRISNAYFNNITYVDHSSSVRAFSIFDNQDGDVEDDYEQKPLRAYTPR